MGHVQGGMAVEHAQSWSDVARGPAEAADMSVGVGTGDAVLESTPALRRGRHTAATEQHAAAAWGRGGMM